jgi:hypothetical protein
MFSKTEYLWHPVHGFCEFLPKEVPTKMQEGWRAWSRESGWGVGSLKEAVRDFRDRSRSCRSAAVTVELMFLGVSYLR